MACRSMIAACDWVIGPGDGVPGGAIFAAPCVPQQFADDSGVGHCPPQRVARRGFSDMGWGPSRAQGNAAVHAVDAGNIAAARGHLDEAGELEIG
jgi:hypothetical protein